MLFGSALKSCSLAAHCGLHLGLKDQGAGIHPAKHCKDFFFAPGIDAIHPPRRPFRGWHAAPRRRKYNRFEFRGWHAAPRRRKYGQQGGVAGWAYPPTTPPCSWRSLLDVRRGGMDLSTRHAAFLRAGFR